METFTHIKHFVDDPHYEDRRRKHRIELDIRTIDRPIADLIGGLAKLPYCFTLQSCYGHFLYAGQDNPRNTEPLPASDSIVSVEYRLAYLALCIQNSGPGKALFENLALVPAIDPDYIQWGCAEWFWRTHLNCYVLQVEPARHMNKDRVRVDYPEALHLEKIRNRFFNELGGLLRDRIDEG